MRGPLDPRSPGGLKINPNTETLLDGLTFTETPRWHEDRLWFTDQFTGRVMTVSLGGDAHVVVELDDRVGGLGWLPDGALLVVAMTERRIYRVEDGNVVLHADIYGLCSFHCNDMVVDDAGNAFVGNFGYDLDAGAPVAPAELVRVSPAGESAVVATDLIFPNGCVIDPEESRLIVAETFASRLTSFAIGDDRSLGDREVWAELGGVTPDGLCLDAEGAVWVASFGTEEVIRVRRGGERLAVVRPRGAPYACMLGGPARQTLFITTSEANGKEEALRRRSSRIEVYEAEVPGVGLP